MQNDDEPEAEESLCVGDGLVLDRHLISPPKVLQPSKKQSSRRFLSDSPAFVKPSEDHEPPCDDHVPPSDDDEQTSHAAGSKLNVNESSRLRIELRDEESKASKSYFCPEEISMTSNPKELSQSANQENADPE